MTWLAPVFLAAGLAVAAPILFHMWQRTPRGRRLFSSTMFLSVSPPRITQRSRIEHWMLLALRAAALLLIALGFSRPVWRAETQAPLALSPDRTVAILVDVSASLQRAGFWESLQRQVAQKLNALPPKTHLALFTFDRRWTAVVPFSEADRLESAARRQLIQERLAVLKPGWGATRLGKGLAQTIQAVREAEITQPAQEINEVWLVSDLASGADLTGLAGIDWPESTRLVTITPDVPPGSNAGIQWVESRSETDDDRRRVRVTNANQSSRDRFQLAWESTASSEAKLDVHVPAGQSRTLLVPPRPADVPESAALTLTGDDHDFDNRLWSAEKRIPSLWVLYLGGDAADDPAGSRFFLEQALSGAPDMQVSLRTAQDVAESSAISDPPALAVWTDAAFEPPGWLRSVVDRGGAILAVPRTAEDARQMLAWTGIAASDIAEAAVTDYSLLSDIDFEDPLFATFAEARFADFTGIHFWKHRRLVLPPSFTGQVLTRFDNHDPFLVRHPFGEGRAWLMTSGWQPGDSQLARSSKFAPLMFRLLEQSMPFAAAGRQGHVGDEILWPFSRPSGSVIVQSPDGVRAELAGASTPFSNTDRPGMYTADCGQEAASWAVNLAPDESKTDPLPRETLERYGILTDRPQLAAAAEASPTRERQLQWEELERRQQLWKWCLLAGGLLLLLETVWAAIPAPRRRLPEGPAT